MATHHSVYGPIPVVAMKANSQSGYALALLLWMITGMSLMVTAVIHFAREDIGLSELRINEAKSQALARGLGYLVSRDMALKEFEALRSGVENEELDVPDRLEDKNGGVTQRQSVGPYEYGFERALGRVFVRPASGFVSLNNASEAELFRTLVALGQVGSGDAANMTRGIIDYRNQVSPVSREMTDFRGYRFKEELLIAEGMTRSVYDRVKDFVHVHRTSGIDPNSAPLELASIFTGEQGEFGVNQSINGGGNGEQNPPTSVPLSAGPVTFDEIYQIRRSSSNPGTDVKAITVELAFDNGFYSRYVVWMSGSGAKVLRAERLSKSQRAAT